MSLRLAWRDGDRVRVVEAAAGSGRYRVSVDGVEIALEVEWLDRDIFRLVTPQGAVLAEVTAAGERRFVRLGAMDFVFEREGEEGRTLRAGAPRRSAAHGSGLEAPMPGVVTRVMAAVGEEVRKGQPLVVLEAMKMEHVIRAPRDGRVRSVAASAGEMVSGGMPLVELED